MKHSLIPKPIDIVKYRCDCLESKVRRLTEDLEFMKKKFETLMKEKEEAEKLVIVEKPDSVGWLW
tara:strand:+ start:98 stop:292 length:195 start_codon:yes stop_codon:yes gene_type:complete